MKYVQVNGDIDLHTGPGLREALYALIAEGPPNFIIHMGGVRFIDSTGLGILLGVLRRVQENSGRLGLICKDAHVLKIFTITRLHAVFEIYESEEKALQAFLPQETARTGTEVYTV